MAARKVFGRICMLYAPRAEERAGLTSRRRRSHVDSAAAQGKSRTARDRRDADYRWHDLIKHVDCSSAFMANFTLFVSTESYFFSGRDWFMQYARLIRDPSSVSTDIVGFIREFFPPDILLLSIIHI